MTPARTESKLGFDKIRETIAARCATDYAAHRVAEEAFSSDPREIRSRLALTEEMRLILLFEDNFPSGGYIDALPFLSALENPSVSLDALSLGKLGTLLDTVRRLRTFFGSAGDGVYPLLKKRAGKVPYFPEVTRRIESILDRHGDIKDSASPALAQIRARIREKEQGLSRRAEAVLRRAQAEGLCEADAGVTMRDGRLLIPVSTALKRKLPGFVFGESASGKTSFIQPAEVMELENEIRELRYDESREISAILRAFSDFVRPYAAELQKSAVFVGETDFLMAKAQTALDFVAGLPVISEDGRLDLRKARHPLLEKALAREQRSIVPVSVHLDPKGRILLISGPNAGGKSVCLKTVGLLQYMFQWGMLIPTSESSELPVFKQITVSIGDDQSLENDLSTYSSFLADMREMLREAGPGTLVLIDEFGSGTEPAAGGAIAEAILAELDRRGVYGVMTTHYTNLKLFASAPDNAVVNGAMRFDTARIEPLFQLETGLPGNSFAFELARKMQLPEVIVKDAEERAGEGFVGMERNLRKIARNRRLLDEKLQKIKHTDKELEALADKYQSELEQIRNERRTIIEEAMGEAENIVKGAGKQLEKTIRDIKEAGAEKEKTKEARAELQGFLGALREKKEKQNRKREAYLEHKMELLGKRKKNASKEEAPKQEPFKVGEKVRIKDSGLVGEVSRVSSKSVTLIVGNISSTLAPNRLERISASEFREVARKSFTPSYQRNDAAIESRRLNFKPELDVRGERLQNALDMTVHFIDDALMLGMGSVRIIHGKGTGVLRDELQKYLRTVPGVASVADEDIRRGGSGVTVITLE